MQHIEMSKRNLIRKIQTMPVEQYEQLTDLLFENFDHPYVTFGKGIFFRCQDCKRLYGNCQDQIDECSARFRTYMLSEAEE